MSELSMRDKGIALDALALIAAFERSDKESFDALLGTFDPDEYEKLITALLGNAVVILRLASQAIGAETGAIIGTVMARLNRAE